ncbi:MAG TPA: phosphoribosyltransferase family protein [Candidatus Caenarcaniphilales bacterium]
MSSPPLFRNRQAAGIKLAQAVAVQAPPFPTVVYALPRGGLPVAEPVSQQLGCPLDVIVAKKITEPQNPELALGAVTADGQVVWANHQHPWIVNSSLCQAAQLQAQQKAAAQLTQLAASRPPVSPTGATAILVDDGIATGMTMAVAIQALRQQHPAAIWICVPVAPPSLIPSLQHWADHVIVLATPDPFWSVSRFYQEFPQVDIEEARACLLHAGV